MERTKLAAVVAVKFATFENGFALKTPTLDDPLLDAGRTNTFWAFDAAAQRRRSAPKANALSLRFIIDLTEIVLDAAESLVLQGTTRGVDGERWMVIGGWWSVDGNRLSVYRDH